VKVVEFPSDIVNAPKDIELAVIVIDGMSISNVRDLAVILKPVILIIAKAECPRIVESG
jgi:hypothetical protein